LWFGGSCASIVVLTTSLIVTCKHIFVLNGNYCLYGTSDPTGNEFGLEALWRLACSRLSVVSKLAVVGGKGNKRLKNGTGEKTRGRLTTVFVDTQLEGHRVISCT